MHIEYLRKLLQFFVLIAIVAKAMAVPSPPLQRVTVRLLIFTSPVCAHCTSVQSAQLDTLAQNAKCLLEYRTYDIRDMGNYKKLVKLEEFFGDSDNEMPVVFIGREVLGGETELQERLEKLVT